MYRVFIVILGVILCAVTPAGAVIEAATPSDRFVDSLGINTHFGNAIYTGTNAYADRRIDAKIGALGIRHIRDHSWNDTGVGICGSLFSTYGVRANLILGETTRSPGDLVNLLKANPAYESIEGLNEPDFTIRSYNSLTDTPSSNLYPATKAFQNDLYAAVKGDPLTSAIPVLSPAMGRANKSQYLIPISFDAAAMHSYPWASPTNRANVPSFGVDQAITDMSALRGTKPLMATESGYDNKPATNTKSVPESIQGKYTPRLYAEFFNRGVQRTYLYEMADQGAGDTREESFGLLRYDLSEKPAYTAMKNLIDLLDDPGVSFAPSSLSYTLTAPSSVHHTLLQKSDGKFYLMLWNELLSYDSINHLNITNPDATVTLALQGLFDAQVFQPNVSAGPIASYFGTNSLTLSVPDQMMVVELVPEPGSAALIAGTVGLLALRRRQRMETIAD